MASRAMAELALEPGTYIPTTLRVIDACWDVKTQQASVILEGPNLPLCPKGTSVLKFNSTSELERYMLGQRDN